MKPALLLLLLLVAAALVWSWAGAQPQHWDSAVHLTESLNANRIGEDQSSSVVRQALFVSWYYPPFVAYSAIPLYRLLGESERTGVLVMAVWFCLFVAATYALGATLYTPQAGLAAGALAAAFPVAVEFSHAFMLDLPLAAMAALTVFLVVRSENFTRIPCSLFAGAAAGCGMLTKWLFPAFVLGPVAVALWGAFRNAGSRRRSIWIFAASLLVAALIAAPWYLVHAVQIAASRGGELREEELRGLGSWLYYLEAIPLQASWPLTLVLAAGVALFSVRVRTRGALLAAWFLTAYLLVSLVGFKMPRFSIGLLTPLALAAAAGIGTLFAVRWIRAAFYALCGTVFLSAQFVPAGSAAGRLLASPVWEIPVLKTDGPRGDAWHQREIVERIARDAGAARIPYPNVRVIADRVFCNSSTLAYQAQLIRLPAAMAGISGYPLMTDYVVLTTGRISDAGAEQERTRLRERILGASPPVYAEVGRWPLPDSSEALLLRFNPQPAAGSGPDAITAALRLSAMQFFGRYLRPVAPTQLDVLPYGPDETRHGRIREVRVRSQAADLGDFAFTPDGIRVNDADIVLRDLRIDPVALVERGSLDVYAIGGCELRGLRIAAKDVAAYAARSGNLRVEELTIRDGTVALRATPREFGRTISIRVALANVGGHDIGFSVEGLRVGWVPVPAALVNAMLAPFTPMLSGLHAVPDVRLGTLVLDNDRIEIRPAAPQTSAISPVPARSPRSRPSR